MSQTPWAERGAGLRTAAWVLYDLANTVYAATLTFLFVPYIEETFGKTTGLGVVNLVSMVFAAFLVPLLGALIDHTTRTGRYLGIATLICIAAMAGFGLVHGEVLLLLCFFAANLAYNVSLLFYNSLLTSVAEPGQEGRISGRGVGVGYGGTILVLVVLLMMLPKEVATTTRFLLAAAMFLLFGLPCLLLVRDHRPPRPGSLAVAVRASFGTLRTALRELPRHRALFWFLLANFCFVDVLNTAILFFAGLTKSVFANAAADGSLVLFGYVFLGDEGLSQFVNIMGLALNGLALVFGLSIGRWTDRSPLAVMAASGIALMLALIGGAVFGGTSALGYAATLVGLGAFGLCGIWTAGRKLVVLLAPPDRIGEYFGLYGITVKLSVFGGLIYAVVRDHHGSKPALLCQCPQLCLGLLFLLMVRLPPRSDHRPIPGKPGKP